MQGHGFNWGLLGAAVGLNLFYVGAAGLVFLRVHHVARRRGLLLNVGE